MIWKLIIVGRWHFLSPKKFYGPGVIDNVDHNWFNVICQSPIYLKHFDTMKFIYFSTGKDSLLKNMKGGCGCGCGSGRGSANCVDIVPLNEIIDDNLVHYLVQ